MVDPISLASLVISLASGFVAWRAYRANVVTEHHSKASAKAIAAQRLTTLLDAGLKLSVVSSETIINFSSDTVAFAALAAAATNAVKDVAPAFPDAVHHIEELRQKAELGSRWSASEALNDNQMVALFWHYERVYTLLELLSAYALARHNPGGAKSRIIRASDDQYWELFDLRHQHFWVATWKLAGILPADFPVPPADTPERLSKGRHQAELKKLASGGRPR
jgi:hypothetical protein